MWVCVCVTVTVKFTDINSVFGLVILTLVTPVYSWDPPEEKKDTSLLSLLLHFHTATALSCVRGLISVLMQGIWLLLLWYCSMSGCREKRQNIIYFLIDKKVKRNVKKLCVCIYECLYLRLHLCVFSCLFVCINRNYCIPIIGDSVKDGSRFILSMMYTRGGERVDFTECVHLNLSHCLSFGKPQNISCLHARGGGSLNAYYYLGVTGSRTLFVHREHRGVMI